jgi:hypothetical protein
VRQARRIQRPLASLTGILPFALLGPVACDPRQLFHAGDCAPKTRLVAPGDGLAVRGRRRADVDGDGTPDRVAIVADYAAPRRCRFFLVAVTRRSSSVVILDQGAEAATRRVDREIPWPRLYSLPRIDRRPGAEIAVVVDQGAETAFLALFTYGPTCVASRSKRRAIPAPSSTDSATSRAASTASPAATAGPDSSRASPNELPGTGASIDASSRSATARYRSSATNAFTSVT